MPEIKNTLLKGRMNKDLDERLVPNGEYRDALKLISSELLAKKELNGEAMDFLTDVAFGEATFEDYTEWSSRASESWQ